MISVKYFFGGNYVKHGPPGPCTTTYIGMYWKLHIGGIWSYIHGIVILCVQAPAMQQFWSR